MDAGDKHLNYILCLDVEKVKNSGGLVATQLTEYPVNLCTRMFLNWITRFYLTQFLFPFTQFYFYPKINRQNRVIT